MSFLELCKAEHLIDDKDRHKNVFVDYIQHNTSEIIEIMKPRGYGDKVHFYYYLAHYCPEQYSRFLPDLVEDLVRKDCAHYINTVSRQLFIYLPKNQQYAIAYQLLEEESTSDELQKQMIQYLYDDASRFDQLKQHSNTALDDFKYCLEQVKSRLHPKNKIMYEVELYLAHLNSPYHQADYLEKVSPQRALFKYEDITPSQQINNDDRQFDWARNRLTYPIQSLTSLSLLDELRYIQYLAPKTVICLLQLALEYVEPQTRLHAQYALCNEHALSPHIDVVLRSSEYTYKKHALQWLLLKECTIQISRDTLVHVLEQDKTQRLHHYIYQLFIKYQYDLTGYFDQNTIIKNAQQHLKKVPASLTWLNKDDLPNLVWKDQQPVDKQVPYAWLCQTANLSDLLHHSSFKLYLDLLDAESQIRFSRFVIESFIAQDLQQSAAKCKGILVFTTALPLNEHIQYIEDYFKQAQQHVPQLKAMLETLLRPEDPTALLYLLNAKGFARKPSIDEYRIELLKLVMNDFGITHPQHFNQLFTPTLGFNSVGEATYFYQNQSFTLRITSELKLALYDDKDKKISKLPKSTTDEEQEKWQKLSSEIQNKTQNFLALIKQLKSDYRTIYRQRSISFGYDDWLDLMFYHPILRHISHRLIWEVYNQHNKKITCLADDEGKFIDINGQKIVFETGDRLNFSYSANWGKDWENTWREVFKAQQRVHLWQKNV